MSEQSRLAFESIYPVPDGLWFHKDGDYINKQDTPNDYNNMWHTWKAATAEANKRIEALEGEVAELNNWKNQAIEVENEWDVQAVGRALNIQLGHSIRAGILHKINELQANNNDLREALEMFVKDCTGKVIHSTNWLTQQGRKALAATPAESLAKHDADLIENVIAVIESLNVDAMFKPVSFSDMFVAIRALKGK